MKPSPNFKIPNDFFTIQPDFRDQTIDINIRAIDSSNAYKYEQYDSFNYLSDPYIIRIVEQNIPSGYRWKAMTLAWYMSTVDCTNIDSQGMFYRE